MEHSKTQSGEFQNGDLVILVEQVANPSYLHRVGAVYRVLEVEESSRKYVRLSTLNGKTHRRFGALARRLKKI